MQWRPASPGEKLTCYGGLGIWQSKLRKTQKTVPLTQRSALWTADSRGGMVRLDPDGSQRIVTQKISGQFEAAKSEASRYLEGTLPNGLAFARNGDILISNFGTTARRS